MACPRLLDQTGAWGRVFDMMQYRRLFALVLLAGGMAVTAAPPDLTRAQGSPPAQQCDGKDGACPVPAPSPAGANEADAMDPGAFWKIIEGTRAGSRNDDDFLRRINARLKKLTPEELLAYERRHSLLATEAYTWKLWGAAYLMTGGCADDCFVNFRSWLMSLSRRTFEKAVKDPDTLADALGHGGQRSIRIRVRSFEEFESMAPELYEVKTDREMPDSVFLLNPVRQPADERWDFNNKAEMEKRYPRLFARYGR